MCLVLPVDDVRHSRDPWCRQPLPKLKENAIKQMAVIVFLSLLSRPFAAFTDLLYTGRLYSTAETTLCENFTAEIMHKFDHVLCGNSRNSSVCTGVLVSP